MRCRLTIQNRATPPVIPQGEINPKPTARAIFNPNRRRSRPRPRNRKEIQNIVLPPECDDQPQGALERGLQAASTFLATIATNYPFTHHTYVGQPETFNLEPETFGCRSTGWPPAKTSGDISGGWFTNINH
jgi:hypothetical protein